MTYTWPSEDGWPYPDDRPGVADLDSQLDEDTLMLRATPPHMWDSLSTLERRVVTAHYGLNGQAPRSMKELHLDLGLTRADVRDILAAGLAKLRTVLQA